MDTTTGLVLMSRLLVTRRHSDYGAPFSDGGWFVPGGGGVAAPPWLAEQLGVRLFDAKWEARHGAALGLMGLWKAWRAGQRRGKKQPQPSCGQGAGPGLGWLRRVAEVRRRPYWQGPIALDWQKPAQRV